MQVKKMQVMSKQTVMVHKVYAQVEMQATKGAGN